MMEAKKIKSSMDAFDRAREEAEAKTRQRAEEQARKEEEDRRLAQVWHKAVLHNVGSPVPMFSGKMFWEKVYVAILWSSLYLRLIV